MNFDIFDHPSEEIDRFYGFRIDFIEADLLKTAKTMRPEGVMANFSEALYQGHEVWIGLDPQVLNTPYDELVQLCRFLSPDADEIMVDLGAGYGRLGLVLNTYFPKTKFLGYELVSERVEEGQRIFKERNCENAQLLCQDLMHEEFELPVAQYYFIYDFGKVAHIRRILEKLEKLADHHHFKVIARGKGVRSLIEHEHKWLTSLNDVHHEEHFSIYSY